MAKLRIRIGKTEFMAEGNPEHIEKEFSLFTEMVRNAPVVVMTQAGKGAKVVKHKSEQIAWENLADNLQLYDEFECNLSDGNRATFVLINESEGYLTFCSKDCMTRHRMNNINVSNKSGIADSEMQKYLDEEIWNLLPDGLKNIISETRRKYKDGDQTKEFDTKLFLLSASEVFDEDHCYGEEKLYDQIEYFKDERNRIKCIDKETAPWWLSSPYVGFCTHFCYVTSAGGASYYAASPSHGVVPCFRIKKS